MLRKVTGQKDPAMVLLRELVSESGRVKHGLFITEELELVRRAFEYGGNVTHVIVSERHAESPGALELMKRAEQMNIDICCASEGLLAKLLEAKPIPDFFVYNAKKACSAK